MAKNDKKQYGSDVKGDCKDVKIEEPVNKGGNKKRKPKYSGPKDAKPASGGRGKPYFNDPSWLDHNPALTRDAASIGFYQRIGRPELVNGTTEGSLQIKGEVTSPGLLTLYYVPTVGVAETQGDTVNLAAHQISSFMRTQISGSRSYEPADVMMYILALSSIYDAINAGARMYYFSQSYNAWNLHAPTAYLEAMGVDPDTIQGNETKVREDLNQLIISANR